MRARSSFLAFSLGIAPAAARADACDVCSELDRIEEDCEAEFGDGTALCEEIGEVEEPCPEEGDEADDEEEEGEEAEDDLWGMGDCPELCDEVPDLRSSCEAGLGAGHSICADLAALQAGECADGDSTGCQAGAAGGGALLALLPGLLLRARRRAP